jgi:hypothetical protein
MQWFFCCNANGAGWFNEMVRVAVLSAREYTSLEPNCLFDGEECHLTRWLKSNGVKVHFVSVPFRDELFSERVVLRNKGAAYSPENATGHFLRVLVSDYADSELVLYTDCDVMFVGNPIVPQTKTIAAAPEIDARIWKPHPGSFNSGIMAINCQYFGSVKEALIGYFGENCYYDPQHSSYDQVLLNRFFSGKWDALPQEMNWRPALGINPQAQIVHFHGPKPHRVRAILNDEALSGEQNLKRIIEANEAAYHFYVDQFFGILKLA